MTKPAENRVLRAQLRRLGACSNAIRWVCDEDLESAQSAWDRCHTQEWMIWYLDHSAARETCDLALRPAAEAYGLALRPAAEAYELARRTAREAYELALRTARETYDLALRPARETYDLARRPAEEAYCTAIRGIYPTPPIPLRSVDDDIPF